MIRGIPGTVHLLNAWHPGHNLALNFQFARSDSVNDEALGLLK